MENAVKVGDKAAIRFLDKELSTISEHSLTLPDDILPTWNMVQDPKDNDNILAFIGDAI